MINQQVFKEQRESVLPIEFVMLKSGMIVRIHSAVTSKKNYELTKL